MNTDTTETTNKKPSILKRNPIGVQASTISKVASQIAAAESAQTQEYEVRQVILADIQLWEEQPRKFHLKLQDVWKGEILKEDKFYNKKNEELEGIISLAMSLKEFGMLNPPLAYALPGKKIQLIGGQRRTMAFMFSLFHLRTIVDEEEKKYHEVFINQEPDLSQLERERIPVKVFLRRPNEIILEQLGIVDNVQRTELPISDKLNWLIRFADQLESNGRIVTWRDLVDTLGLSRSQAYEWLSVVQSRHDEFVKKVIEKVCFGSTTFARLLEIVRTESSDRPSTFKKWFEMRPEQDANLRISLGKTNNLNALRMLVLSNVEEEIRKQFESIDWNNPKTAKKGFSEFLEYWERKHG